MGAHVAYAGVQHLGCAALRNLTVDAGSGDLFGAEDGGNMEVVVITPEGDVASFCRVADPLEENSEITGPCFNPDRNRLYFSSQRGKGSRLTRDQLVEAIVDPNARISPGYEGVLLVLEDDELIAGRIVEETEEYLVVLPSDGKAVEVETAAVLERRPDLSSMPEGLGQLLTRRQMRDLVEYLSTR